MSIPDFQTLMLPVLKAASKGEVHIGQIVDQLANEMNLSEEEREKLLPSGKQEVFSNRVQWAKSYLSKAQLIEITRRGYFKITERGIEVLKTSPDRIDIAFLMKFEEFREFRDRTKDESQQDNHTTVETLINQEKTPDEIMRLAHQQINTSLGLEILDRIRLASPTFFERSIVSLLLGMGYGGSAADAGRAIGRSGDDGVDGVIDQDSLGLDRVYIQAKRYAIGNNVSSGAIRDFFGSLDIHKATKGLFVTTSDFSPAARQTAESLGKRIVLINGSQLAHLMLRYNVGCRVEETLQIKKIDEEFFE